MKVSGLYALAVSDPTAARERIAEALRGRTRGAAATELGVDSSTLRRIERILEREPERLK